VLRLEYPLVEYEECPIIIISQKSVVREASLTW
jgi:hypothetical protein